MVSYTTILTFYNSHHSETIEQNTNRLRSGTIKSEQDGSGTCTTHSLGGKCGNDPLYRKCGGIHTHLDMVFAEMNRGTGGLGDWRQFDFWAVVALGPLQPEALLRHTAALTVHGGSTPARTSHLKGNTRQ